MARHRFAQRAWLPQERRRGLAGPAFLTGEDSERVVGGILNWLSKWVNIPPWSNPEFVYYQYEKVECFLFLKDAVCLSWLCWVLFTAVQAMLQLWRVGAPLWLCHGVTSHDVSASL